MTREQRVVSAPPRWPGLAVLEYYLVSYRRTWRASVLSSFLLPVLSMLGFGLGVGAYVTGGVAGVPYFDYVVPGLMAATAAQVAVGESTWPVFSNFEWMKTYFAQAAAPLRVRDVLVGHLGFVCLRVLASGLVFLAVAAAFGAVHSVWALVVAPVLVLVGLAVAAPVFGYTSSVSSDNYLALLFRFGVIPMTLFSGVFFPVGSLPVVLRAVAYALPLWHGVDLCRAAALGVAPDWSVAGHLIVLAGWSVFGWFLARTRFRRRLVV
nr:ABC transporter permease [Plantactinospora sp. KBS50]